MLRQASLDAVGWPDLPGDIPPLTVAVNVSSYQLRDPWLLIDVQAALSPSGLPADRQKLDRGVVSTLAEGSSAVVAETIVHLGDLLELDVVAEGIETEDQLNACRELGCRLGQGFLFARPTDLES
ncbi:MAG TPA: EAL domain-containing protein [Mycobacteriales bacterium]|nr:EAL domain-containing protein [Mycobacteriales bacterium]